MGYPCAVGISAPLSIVRGAGEAAEKGILMRTGEAFQGYRLVTRVAFDKTGTLTEGRPRIREIEAISGNTDELLVIAEAAEASSEHPLAQAVVEAAFEVRLTLPEADAFEAIPGKGIAAKVAGHDVLVGSPRFLAERGVALTMLDERTQTLEAQGRTVITVARNGKLLGLLAFGDAPRPDAAETIRKLREAGVKTVLITGEDRKS